MGQRTDAAQCAGANVFRMWGIWGTFWGGALHRAVRGRGGSWHSAPLVKGEGEGEGHLQTQ